MTTPASFAARPKHSRHKHPRHPDASQPDPKLVLLLACGAVLIATLDLTVVNVAFPNLRADFHSASLPTLSWVVTAYGVMFAALLAGAGRIAGVVGQQRLFTWSVGAFTVTSALAAIAPDENFLILFRALQGIAAAGMSPTALGLIITWTPADRLMTAIGIWGATASLAAAIGPTVGGTLTDALGWRAIFVINVPIGLALLYKAVAGLGRDTPSERRLPDLVGTALFAVGVGGVVVGLSQASEWGWTSRSVLISVVCGVLCVGVALARSAHHPVPALELDLWRNRTFALANATSALVNAGAFASVFSGTLFLTGVWNYSAFKAGLALTPGAFAGALGAFVAGKRTTTPAARRTVVIGGALVTAAASLFMSVELGAEERFVEVFLPAALAAGVGLGATFTALFGAGVTSTPPTRFASGSGLLTMSRQLGGVIGVAAGAAILAAPGYSAPVDPFQAVYLLCAVVALAGAAVGVGLPGHNPAPAPAANGAMSAHGAGAGSSIRGDGPEPATAGGIADTARRRHGVVALASLTVLAVAMVYSVAAAGRDAGTDGARTDGPALATASAPAPASVTAGRSLVLIDVSASMGQPAGVGTAGLPAITQAVVAGVGPAPGTAEVGVWVFGSRLWGDLDWAQLLPVGPLDERLDEATRRELLQTNLGRLGAVPDDHLGLYDSVSAALRAMTSLYEPGVRNTVVVFTDGRDDDPAGTTLDRLLATVGEERDPARPVQIHIIGYGDRVDRDAIARIAEATGGKAYTASSPQQAQEFFTIATSDRG